MFGLGGGELIVIFFFALLFIGPKKLPQLAKGLGKAIGEFQRAKSDFVDEIHSASVIQDDRSEVSLDNKETVKDLDPKVKEKEGPSKQSANPA